MNSEKSIIHLKQKKDKSPNYLSTYYCIYQFVNNFLAFLLRKINIPDFFDMGEIFKFLFYR